MFFQILINTDYQTKFVSKVDEALDKELKEIRHVEEIRI